MARRVRGRRRGNMADDEDLVDAARALAAFSKQVRFVEDEFSIWEVKWVGKRKRGTRKRKAYPGTIGMQVVSNSAVDFPLVKEEYSDSDKGEMGLPAVAYNRFDTGSEEDSLPNSRAESPNSPLPPLGNETSSAYVKTEVGVKRKLAGEDKQPCKRRATREPKLELVKFNGSEGKPRRPSGRGRCSKIALTEEEKESRRLRRIEANRESARQTIRKKQKLCEEMTARVAELVAGNEQYRKDIQRVREDMDRLHEENCSMRSQLAVSVPSTSGSDISSDVVDANSCNPLPEQSSGSVGLEEPVIRVQMNRQDDIDLIDFSPPRVRKAASPSPTTTPCSKVKSTQTSLPQLQVAMPPTAQVARAYYSAARQQPGMYPYRTDKQVFAEARRRRKELQQTKGKNIYSRQAILNS